MDNLDSLPTPFPNSQTPIEPGVLELIREERAKALSPREWQFRLRGHGYAIKSVAGEQVLTRLPKGNALGVLPSEFS